MKTNIPPYCLPMSVHNNQEGKEFVILAYTSYKKVRLKFSYTGNIYTVHSNLIRDKTVVDLKALKPKLKPGAEGMAIGPLNYTVVRYISDDKVILKFPSLSQHYTETHCAKDILTDNVKCHVSHKVRPGTKHEVFGDTVRVLRYHGKNDIIVEFSNGDTKSVRESALLAGYIFNENTILGKWASHYERFTRPPESRVIAETSVDRATIHKGASLHFKDNQYEVVYNDRGTKYYLGKYSSKEEAIICLHTLTIAIFTFTITIDPVTGSFN